MTGLERDFAVTGQLCPRCGKLVVADFNRNSVTRRQAWWGKDFQQVQCESCGVAMVRNGAGLATSGQRAWKRRYECPCGVSPHGHGDVCTYFAH